MKKILLAFVLSILIASTAACGMTTLPTTTTTIATTASSTMLSTTTQTTAVPTTTTLAPSTTRALRADESADIALDFDLSAYVYEEPTVAIDLPAVLANHAVLQQKKPIRVYGTGTPGGIALVKLVKDDDPSVQYQNAGIVAADGTFRVELPALYASFDVYTLTVSDTETELYVRDLLIGEVWIASGQSNMAIKVREMDGGTTVAAAAADDAIRVFYPSVGEDNYSYPFLPAADVTGGVWKTADAAANVLDCSGIGYVFAKELKRLLAEENLSVPVAIVSVAKGGSNLHPWLPRAAMQTSSAITSYVTAKGWTFSQSHWNEFGWTNYNQPSALFNRNIAPLFDFQIGGVLWYQGESDAVYDPTVEMISLLIDSWSAGFNQNDELLPFVMIQLAPYDGNDPFTSAANPMQIYYAHHRQAQLEVIRLPRYSATTVLVPIHDVSLTWDVPSTQFAYQNPIHPTVKIPVGERAGKEAYTAFFYGAVDFLPPTVTSISFDATTITIAFAHVARGLKLYKDAASGIVTMEAFRANGTRFALTATILDATHVLITGVDTTEIAFVAYGYRSRNEAANLASSYNIPAIPFKLPLV
ncbi:MAG: sialate O-acetylesterase [Bacillota bacterium]|nr:sialate O-acetylesterase [Bacillota bacterium]